ncbi:MAG: hypothetical protein LiPW30_749 [Parcubacteria group bacterium LiPW_30]|nr:MAG: hypothetical protein LiPW30_749 [Parcubacteria group bacterium LiPW_30]
MSKLLIILLAVLIIIAVAGAGIYYFIYYSPAATSNLANPTNGNQKPAPKVEKQTFLGFGTDDLEEIMKEESSEIIEGIIKVSDGKIIKDKLGDTVEHTLYVVTVTTDNKEYAVAGFDESEYADVGIKDGQKVKVYGSFIDKSKTLFLAGAVIPI